MQTHKLMGGFMKYAVELGSDIENLIWGGGVQKHRASKTISQAYFHFLNQEKSVVKEGL